MLAVGVSACVTVSGLTDEEALTKAGATRLNATQVKAHVTGKSEAWTYGGAYYIAGGQLKVMWRKVYSTGSWEVSDDGTLCYQVPRWKERCHIYMNYEGQVVTIEEGRNMGTRELLEGDKLAVLKRTNEGNRRR